MAGQSRTLKLSILGDVDQLNKSLKAANADVWLVNALVQNADDVKNADSKNALFIAFKTKQLYNQDNRRTQNGGLDFWESGALNPHLVLADLIAIFHPELMPNHVFVYYRKLP